MNEAMYHTIEKTNIAAMAGKRYEGVEDEPTYIALWPVSETTAKEVMLCRYIQDSEPLHDFAHAHIIQVCENQSSESNYCIVLKHTTLETADEIVATYRKQMRSLRKIKKGEGYE